MAAATQDIPLVLQASISSGFLLPKTTSHHPYPTSATSWAHFYDLDALDTLLTDVVTSFPPNFLHCFAVKSNPLTATLKTIHQRGLGLECASFNEVLHSINAGCNPQRIVFDSPCKTKSELHHCLQSGVLINCDNFDEMNRVAELIKDNKYKNTVQVGLRINPLLGKGTIEALSVSTHDSKFGIPLTPSNHSLVLAAFEQHEWLTGLHSHVGSQGCGLEMLAKGVSTLISLANEIDAIVSSSPHQPRITVVDIGGGLPTNFDSDQVSPTFTEYVNCLKEKCPALFEHSHRRIITEFGRALICKVGWTASKIEYVKITPDESKKRILIIHAGSDMFLRKCYSPDSFPLRIEGYQNPQNQEKHLEKQQERKGEEEEEEEGDEEEEAAGFGVADQAAVQTILTDVAGPLCFGGDKVGRKVLLNSTLNVNDFIVVRDTGANCLSLWSRHCSRSAPQVIGYRRNNTTKEVKVVLLKPAETPEQVLSIWG